LLYGKAGKIFIFEIAEKPPWKAPKSCIFYIKKGKSRGKGGKDRQD
jgi:hypothetical protein